jgi:hypothetical protein
MAPMKTFDKDVKMWNMLIVFRAWNIVAIVTRVVNVPASRIYVLFGPYTGELHLSGLIGTPVFYYYHSLSYSLGSIYYGFIPV